MKRRFNYTGRKSIPAGMVAVAVLPPGDDGVRSFDAQFGDLLSLGLPGDAMVYIEPYVKSSSMRFAFGTVGSVVPPRDRTLPEIDDGAGVLFRVLVVDEADKVGRLLAMGDKITPVGDEQQRDALLPLVTEDLGEAVWLLDAAAGNQPRLLINSRFPGLKQKMLEDPLLMGAILPLAVRDALRAVRQEQDDDAEWVKKWRRFVKDVAGDSYAEVLFDDGDDDEDQVNDAIDHVCELLIQRRQYLTRALRHAGSIADA